MRAGSVRRRCRCRDDNGKDLGSRCPKLSRRGHGSWQIRQELPSAADEQRRTFRRLGYATQDKAQEDLDRVRALIALGEDEHDSDAIATMLLGLATKDPIPKPEDVRRKLRSGQDLSDDPTVGEWLDVWIAQKARRESTITSYLTHINLYLKPLIGHIRLSRLNVGHVTDMFARIVDDNDAREANNEARRDLKERIAATSSRTDKQRLREQLAALPPHREPAGPETRRRIRSTLRAAINAAIAQHKATFNAAAHVEMDVATPEPIVWTPERVEHWRQTGLRPGPVMVWTPELAGQFLDYVAEHYPEQEPLWHLATFRGPRRGELAGLSWTEVSLTAGTIKIVTQLSTVRGRVIEGAPKSKRGVRTIPLDAETVRLLRRHRAHQGRERLRLGAAWMDSGRVFTQPDGSALNPNQLYYQFNKIVAASGLPPIRLHDLRHTAATLMLAARVDLKIIQETLGHSAVGTTANIYTSVLPQLAADAAEATAAIVPRRTLGHPSGTPAPATSSVTGATGTDGDIFSQFSGDLSGV